MKGYVKWEVTSLLSHFRRRARKTFEPIYCIEAFVFCVAKTLWLLTARKTSVEQCEALLRGVARRSVDYEYRGARDIREKRKIEVLLFNTEHRKDEACMIPKSMPFLEMYSECALGIASLHFSHV